MKTLKLYSGYNSSPELKQEVKTVQERLVSMGYKVDCDGMFGPGTETAVKDFQKKHGLVADGIVGRMTYAALEQPVQMASTPKATSNGLLTNEILQQIIPNATQELINKYVPVFNEELPKQNIDTPLRVAHFIAQVAHESGGLRYTIEKLNYSAKALRSVFGKYFPTDELAEQYARKPEMIANRVYSNRMGNGDEASGDGWKFRGRGLIQLTGTNNYTACGSALGKDLLSNPDYLSNDPQGAILSACWFWNANHINALADQDDVKAVTRRINGGYHGLDDRIAYLERAKQALHIS